MRMFLVLCLAAFAAARPQLSLERRFPIPQLGEELEPEPLLPQPRPQPRPQPQPFVPAQPPVSDVSFLPEEDTFELGSSDLPSSVQPIESAPEPLQPVFLPAQQEFVQPLQGSAVQASPARSHLDQDPRFAHIVTEDRLEPTADGHAGVRYETSDGVKRVERTQPDADGFNTVKGSYSYTSPEGVPVVVYYEADRHGFRVRSDALPTPPPMPPHALEQYLRGQRLHAEKAARLARGEDLS